MKYCDVRMNVMYVYTTGTVMMLYTIHAHVFSGGLTRKQFFRIYIFTKRESIFPFLESQKHLALHTKRKLFFGYKFSWGSKKTNGTVST